MLCLTGESRFLSHKCVFHSAHSHTANVVGLNIEWAARHSLVGILNVNTVGSLGKMAEKYFKSVHLIMIVILHLHSNHCHTEF